MEHGAAGAAARIRPRQQSVELTVPLPAAPHHYDAARGREYALRVAEAGAATAAAAAAPSAAAAAAAAAAVAAAGMLDSLRLASARVPMATHYAVGVLAGGELHLNPVRGLRVGSVAAASFFRA